MRKAARSNSRGNVKAARLSHREGAHHPLHSAKQRVPAPLPHPLVGVIMGSKSDWETMANTTGTLERLGIPFEVRVVSAHRTPDAGAGGAAHLPGVTAAKTTLPVLGVPVESKVLKGLDSLLSMVQMPAGIPVGTLAVGRSGAVNAALLAAAILANKYPKVREALSRYRKAQAEAVLARPDPRATV